MLFTYTVAAPSCAAQKLYNIAFLTSCHNSIFDYKLRIN